MPTIIVTASTNIKNIVYAEGDDIVVHGSNGVPAALTIDGQDTAVAPLIDDFIRAVAQANALMADIEAQLEY